MRLGLLSFVLAVGLLSSCSGSGDTSAGRALFEREAFGEVRGCATCHSADDRPAVEGPSLIGIGDAAGQRIDGVGAADYLRESILAPRAYFADGWGEGMPSYAGVLDADEVEALVDYLLSLR